ncbi:MAG: transporter [Rhizobacter sp.]|nr:transporter [Rhizobacter sp.]
MSGATQASTTPPTPSLTADDDPRGNARLRSACWALLLGNFVIGSGVMMVAGTLNDVAQSLRVSVSVAGQLMSVGAAAMCFGAPLLAGAVSRIDRRRLLTGSLLVYAIGHALCALMPTFATLLPVRALAVLGAAVFTPQAAAAIGVMAPPSQRGRCITFIFLGWSVASVAGVPIGAWMGGTFGWRSTFWAVAVVSVIAAAGVYRVLPSGIRPAAMSWQAWSAVLKSPVLMAIVFVTALSGAGQFTVFSYIAPYSEQVLGASPTQIALLLCWFGLCGLLGNLIVSRGIDRIGASRTVLIVVSLLALGLLLWPLATSFAAAVAIMLPWGLGVFSSNSAQQARLNQAAPAMAPALMALNTSAIYLGQAVGAFGGGWLYDHSGWDWVSWVGFAWLLAALALSAWAGHKMRMR